MMTTDSAGVVALLLAGAWTIGACSGVPTGNGETPEAASSTAAVSTTAPSEPPEPSESLAWDDSTCEMSEHVMSEVAEGMGHPRPKRPLPRWGASAARVVNSTW